jgi:hypothetical protein
MPRQSKTRGAACIIALLGLLAAGAEAAAQSDGVFVDPKSPAGKEYALPLDKARQDAAPNPGGGGSQPGETELFGAGISKRGGGGQDGGNRSETGRSDRGDDDNERGAEGGAGVDARSVSKAAASSGSGISSGWLTALVACAVLLVGGIAGLSLRALRGT